MNSDSAAGHRVERRPLLNKGKDALDLDEGKDALDSLCTRAVRALTALPLVPC